MVVQKHISSANESHDVTKYTLRGSVTLRLRCGMIFSDGTCVANLLLHLTIGEVTGRSLMAYF